jgi:hypothetical protein
VITVADLLSRNAPAPLREGDPDTDGISVGALLRREGHAPRAADRPVQPRPRQQQASSDDDGRPDRRVLVRRGAIAAGTLLAAGSVLGATLFTDVVPTVNQAPTPGGEDDGGAYPGQGLLDPEGPVGAPADPVVIDQAAATDPLDPGTAAPTDWVPVAFPGALAGSNTGSGDSADDGTTTGDSATADDGGNNSGSSDSTSDEGSSAAAAADDDDDDDDTTNGSSDDNDSSGNSGSRNESGSDDSGNSDDDNDEDDEDDDKGLVGDLVDTVGGVLGLGGDDSDDSDRDSDDGDSDEDDERSGSARLFSAESDEDEEDSSAPQDEDDSKSSDDKDDEGDSDSSSDDDGDGGGLIGGLLGTVGGLLR